MYRCEMCGFEFPLDDVEIALGEGRCVCLRCYARRAHEEKRMPSDLQKDVGRAANDAQGGTP